MSHCYVGHLVCIIQIASCVSGTTWVSVSELVQYKLQLNRIPNNQRVKALQLTEMDEESNEIPRPGRAWAGGC